MKGIMLRTKFNTFSFLYLISLIFATQGWAQNANSPAKIAQRAKDALDYSIWSEATRRDIHLSQNFTTYYKMSEFVKSYQAAEKAEGFVSDDSFQDIAIQSNGLTRRLNQLATATQSNKISRSNFQNFLIDSGLTALDSVNKKYATIGRSALKITDMGVDYLFGDKFQVFSQMEFSNIVSRVSLTDEAILKSFWEIARKDRRADSIVNSWGIGPYTPHWSAEQILGIRPELKRELENQEYLKNIYQLIIEGNVSKADLNEFAEENEKRLMESGDKLLAQIGHLLDDQIKKHDQLERDAFEAHIFITSQLAQAMGGEEGVKAARVIQGIGSFTLGMDKAISLFNENFKLNQGLASLKLSGDLLSLGISLVNSFLGIPSFEQVVLEQLNKLGEQINELHKQMHERFDNLDKRILDVYKDLSNQLLTLRYEVRDVHHELKRARRELGRIYNRLDRIEARFSVLNKELIEFSERSKEEGMLNDINLCLFRDKRFREEYVSEREGTVDFFNYCASKFRAFATDLPEIRELIGNGPRYTYEPDEILAKLSTLENATDYFNQLPYLVPLALKYTRSADTPNVTPAKWIFGAKAYANLVLNSPTILNKITHADLDAIKSEGERLKSFLTGLKLKREIKSDNGQNLFTLFQSEEEARVRRFFKRLKRRIEAKRAINHDFFKNIVNDLRVQTEQLKQVIFTSRKMLESELANSVDVWDPTFTGVVKAGVGLPQGMYSENDKSIRRELPVGYLDTIPSYVKALVRLDPRGVINVSYTAKWTNRKKYLLRMNRGRRGGRMVEYEEKGKLSIMIKAKYKDSEDFFLIYEYTLPEERTIQKYKLIHPARTPKLARTQLEGPYSAEELLLNQWPELKRNFLSIAKCNIEPYKEAEAERLRQKADELLVSKRNLVYQTLEQAFCSPDTHVAVGELITTAEKSLQAQKLVTKALFELSIPQTMFQPVILQLFSGNNAVYDVNLLRQIICNRDKENEEESGYKLSMIDPSLRLPNEGTPNSEKVEVNGPLPMGVFERIDYLEKNLIHMLEQNPESEVPEQISRTLVELEFLRSLLGQ